MGYKPKSDGYLLSMTKAQIIEELRAAEHNFFAMEEALDNSAKAGMKIAEELKEAKQLLKEAVEDLKNVSFCSICVNDTDNNDRCKKCKAVTLDEFKWKHADEAFKLIEKGENDER